MAEPLVYVESAPLLVALPRHQARRTLGAQMGTQGAAVGLNNL
jgi:hypothetical protein